MQTGNNGKRRYKRLRPVAPEPKGSSTITSESVLNGLTIEDRVRNECAMDDVLGTNAAVFPSRDFAASEALADKTHCQLPDDMLLRANQGSVEIACRLETLTNESFLVFLT